MPFLCWLPCQTEPYLHFQAFLSHEEFCSGWHSNHHESGLHTPRWGTLCSRSFGSEKTKNKVENPIKCLKIPNADVCKGWGGTGSVWAGVGLLRVRRQQGPAATCSTCLWIPPKVRAESKRAYWLLILAAKHVMSCSEPAGGADKIVGISILQSWADWKCLLWQQDKLHRIFHRTHVALPKLYLCWKFNRLGHFSPVKSSLQIATLAFSHGCWKRLISAISLPNSWVHLKVQPPGSAVLAQLGVGPAGVWMQSPALVPPAPDWCAGEPVPGVAPPLLACFRLTCGAFNSWLSSSLIKGNGRMPSCLNKEKRSVQNFLPSRKKSHPIHIVITASSNWPAYNCTQCWEEKDSFRKQGLLMVFLRQHNTTQLYKPSTHSYTSPLHTHPPSLCNPLSPSYISANLQTERKFRLLLNLQYSWLSQDLHPLCAPWHLLSWQLLVSKTKLQWTTTSCTCVKYYYYIIVIH